MKKIHQTFHVSLEYFMRFFLSWKDFYSLKSSNEIEKNQSYTDHSCAVSIDITG